MGVTGGVVGVLGWVGCVDSRVAAYLPLMLSSLVIAEGGLNRGDAWFVIVSSAGWGGAGGEAG